MHIILYFDIFVFKTQRCNLRRVASHFTCFRNYFVHILNYFVFYFLLNFKNLLNIISWYTIWWCNRLDRTVIRKDPHQIELRRVSLTEAMGFIRVVSETGLVLPRTKGTNIKGVSKKQRECLWQFSSWSRSSFSLWSLVPTTLRSIAVDNVFFLV